MKIEEANEVIQSSCLAPLFLDLDKVTKEEKETRILLKLKFKSPFPTKEPPALVLIGDEGGLRFMIRNLSKTKDANLIARVAHVNHIVTVPKLCWDPEDGEVYVEWSFLTDDSREVSPLVFERIVAHMLQVYYGERRYFMIAELSGLVDKGIIDKSQAEALLKAVADKIDAEFLPPVMEVLRG